MIRFGILGLGNISRRAAIGIKNAKGCLLVGGASSQLEKSERFKDEFHLEKAYGSYDELFLDPSIDAIYVCTPNSTHYDFIKKGLTHMKHILCEKPMVLSTQQLDELFDLAKDNNVFLMEAHKTVFTPLNQYLLEIIQQGTIGLLKAITAEYSHNVFEEHPDLNHWVFNSETGGCSADVGVYPIVFANAIVNSPILKHCSKKLYIKDVLCDVGIRSQIEYENGVVATIQSDWLHTPKSKGSALIVGDRGSIQVDAFWKNTSATITTKEGSYTVVKEHVSEFSGQVEHACECIEKGLHESPVFGRNESKEILRVLNK